MSVAFRGRNGLHRACLGALIESASYPRSAVADMRSERIARKVAEAARLQVPWIAVIGDLEQAENAVALSRPGRPAERLSLEAAIERLRAATDG